MTGNAGKSTGSSRNAAGYGSGSVFSAGSVQRQAYRHVVHAKTVQTLASGDVLRTSTVVARQSVGSALEVGASSSVSRAGRPERISRSRRPCATAPAAGCRRLPCR